MKKLIFIVFSLLSFTAFSQGDQTAISIPGVEPALIHLPTGYNTSIKYPLLVFLHGKGEGGTDLSIIYNSSTAGGPAYFIAHGTWPVSSPTIGVPPSNSMLPMIIVSPQYPSTTTGTSQAQLDVILQYLVKTYSVDVSRIYLTGLSEGGLAITNYLIHSGVTPTYKIAAAVIMSAAIGQPTQAQINQIVSDKVNVWGFGSMSDIFGIQTRILTMGAFNGNGGSLIGLGSLGKFTTYVCNVANGHSCWNTYYDPAYTENGLNIYQWMLQFSAGNIVAPPIITPPVVVVPKVDSAGIVNAYLLKHPCPVVDTNSIIKTYVALHPCLVCPPPVVCPTCPVQRTVIKLINDISAGICYLVYSDGYTQQISK